MFTRQRPGHVLRRSAVVAAIGVATLGTITFGQAAADTPATGKAVSYNCDMPLLGATPTDLGTFALNCTLDPGQDTSLATVTVTS